MNYKLQFVNPYIILKYSKLEEFGIKNRNFVPLLPRYGYFANKVFIQQLSQGLIGNYTLYKMNFQRIIKDHEILSIL